MKLLKLSDGRLTKVDDADFDWLNQWRWFPYNQYVGRQVQRNYKRTTIYLHRFIVDCPEGLEVDHKNGDKLDNQRDNLEIKTHAENLLSHMKLDKRNNSGYRGVSRFKDKWRARRGRGSHIGVFDTAEEAAAALEALDES